MKTIDEQIEDAKKLLDYLEEQKANECAVTEAEPEMPKMWIPKAGHNYYFINTVGEVCSTPWYAVESDVKRHQIGNVYKTREEAEFEAECRRVEFKLRKYIYEHGGGDGKFMPGCDNHYLFYNAEIGALRITKVSYAQTTDIFCNSRAILRDAIQAIGEDRIKKYYLRVKETVNNAEK